MAQFTIYHNPRCSKSRQTLQLLQDHGIEPTVVEYLKESPDAATLRRILKYLKLPARRLIRQREHSALGLPETDDESELVQQMVEHPQIIERPIVVSGRNARIGRPPEQVLELIE